MKNFIGVDNYNFDTPLKKEQKRQSKEKADKICRHLHGIVDVPKQDYKNDEIYNIPCCVECGKELNDEDIEEINRLKEKFNKK